MDPEFGVPQEVAEAEIKKPSVLKQEVDAYMKAFKKPVFRTVHIKAPLELEDIRNDVDHMPVPVSMRGSESDQKLMVLRNYMNVASGDMEKFGGVDEIKRGVVEVVEEALSGVDESKLAELDRGKIDGIRRQFKIGQYAEQAESKAS